MNAILRLLAIMTFLVFILAMNGCEGWSLPIDGIVENTWGEIYSDVPADSLLRYTTSPLQVHVEDEGTEGFYLAASTNEPILFNSAKSTEASTHTWIFYDSIITKYNTARGDHTFKTAGLHLVVLRVGNKNYEREGDFKVLIIAVKACFTIPDILQANTVSTLSRCCEGYATTNLNWGDGTETTDRNAVSHTYATAGTYIITLIASRHGVSDTATKQVVVKPFGSPLSPQACFTPDDNTVVPNANITFTSCASYAASYSYDFGDGQSSTQTSPVHSYSAPGVYTVTQTVSNTYGSDAVSHTITVALPTVPTVKSVYPVITGSNISIKCTVTGDGGAPVLERGVCWGTSAAPTIAASHTSDGTGVGVYTALLTGLSPTTTYYYRAYARNSVGIGYGNSEQLGGPGNIPTLQITTVISTGSTTATVYSEVTGNVSLPVIARGVCWGTASFPTLSNSFTTNGSGFGNFVSHLTGLSATTTYYIRPYATTSTGTTYGLEKILNPAPQSLPAVIGTFATAAGATTANVFANVTNAGGSAVITRGFCWATSHNPTVNSSQVSIGNGTGVFSTILTGLSASTTYYCRAYATNNNGTAYATEAPFTTSAAGFVCGQTITDIDGNVYNTISLAGACWTKENLRTSKFNNGTPIATNISNAAWEITTSPAYAIYDNNPANDAIYGKLYNYFAQASSILAPPGWHVATWAEYETLIVLYGDVALAGGPLKSTSTLWISPNISATNSSGFSGLPAGTKGSTGDYVGMGAYTILGGTSAAGVDHSMQLTHNVPYANHAGVGINTGRSIRLVKD